MLKCKAIKEKKKLQSLSCPLEDDSKNQGTPINSHVKQRLISPSFKTEKGMISFCNSSIILYLEWDWVLICIIKGITVWLTVGAFHLFARGLRFTSVSPHCLFLHWSKITFDKASLLLLKKCSASRHWNYANVLYSLSFNCYVSTGAHRGQFKHPLTHLQCFLWHHMLSCHQI